MRLNPQRRVFDAGYYRALHEPNVELIADDSVERAEGNTVYTKKGRELKADVVVLATGFRVRDCASAGCGRALRIPRS